MKRMKWFFALAIVFALGSAFATPSAPAKKADLYVAVYDGEGNFTWQLLEGSFNQCSENTLRSCAVEADSKPADNTAPAGTIPGEYIP